MSQAVRNNISLFRYNFTFLAIILLYLLLICKLIWFGVKGKEFYSTPDLQERPTLSRPIILDRNGKILATDISSFSLFAQPGRMINIDETLSLLKKVLPKLNIAVVKNRLKHSTNFAWIARSLTKYQKTQIMNLGLPGLGFLEETKRFYPNGADASYIVGYVDIDNKGKAGIEKYIDESGAVKEQKPVQLSIDMRVQELVSETLRNAKDKFHAKAAGAIVLDVTNGEVLAMSSIPGFDPGQPRQALDPNRINRMSLGLYEMGSVMKLFTTAMALDSKKFNIHSIIDVSKPLEVGPHQVIHDFHGKYRPLSVEEIFIYSSNIGSAKEAKALGLQYHRDFLKRIGLIDKLKTQLSELGRTVEPRKWHDINSVTISFGHGIMISPLQLAYSASAIVNGGILRPITFLKNEPQSAGKRVISTKTSSDMLYLLKKNMQEGSGRYANERYYDIGGKTGTAEKVEDNHYSKDKNFNSFLAVFPIYKPKYLVLTIIDDPKAIGEHIGKTAGYNAAPMAVEIINNCATFLGINPSRQKN